MRFSLQLVVLATALGIGATCSAPTCSAQCSEPRPGAKSVLEIYASPVQHKFTLGSPVLVKVSMTNISRHDVFVWLEKGGGENQYEVDVRDQNKTSPANTEYGKGRNGHVHLETLNFKDLIGSGACMPLRRGKTIVYELNVSRLYSLNAPGKYYVRVQRADPESAAIIKSNTVRVTVTP
jgi:hypothetical protein